jgi:DNA-nicking Smr family endonuclease
MKSKKVTDDFKPFANLDGLIKKKRLPLAHQRTESRKQPEDPCAEQNNSADSDSATDEDIFRRAMAGVEPMDRKDCPKLPLKKPPKTAAVRSHDDEVVQRLKDLIETGNGFVVADTPEYIEGVGYRVPREIVARLHEGRYAIQDHIDLHGQTLPEAHASFQRFMKQAVAMGRQGVLIVHGRGLSSPDQPVLKNKVYQWLTSGPWRKWVIAFSSARSYDGGAGATYVLLRRTPMTKGRMKQKRG